MELDDIIYLSLLIFTIVFGYFFRQINDNVSKKWISTIVGCLIVLYVSGIHTFHSVISTVVNSIIILYSSKKVCHIYSFAFSFIYLIFFRTTVYFGIPYPPAHTNLVQMILTLKLVGLAFEVHDSYVESESKETGDSEKSSKTESKIYPKFEDIFHYAYCYIGVLTGPYYSYKTFSDYYKSSFYKYAACEATTLRKLAIVPVYAVIFLILTKYFPVKFAKSDEFYSTTTFWYRMWYMTPVFATFRMRIYIGLVMSEAACTMAGLGAYPAITQPKPGKGPSINYELLEKIEKDSDSKEKTIYNFDTVHNIDTLWTETDPSVRSSIHYWNMCVQYWMAYVVYKRFPVKTFRTAATFTVSAVWHGIYAGYFLCLCSVPFYLPIEDIWEAFRRDATGTKRIILNLVYWVVRTQAFTYMGMAFCLLSMKSGLRYYGSIYYIYHITAPIGLVLGLALKKFMRSGKKVPEELKKE